MQEYMSSQTVDIMMSLYHISYRTLPQKLSEYKKNIDLSRKLLSRKIKYTVSRNDGNYSNSRKDIAQFQEKHNCLLRKCNYSDSLKDTNSCRALM